MIAYLEKTEGNVEFHEVIDFLLKKNIFHRITVSPIDFQPHSYEQFWTSAKSKTIDNVRHITAKVAGKVVSISEASIRTDLIFDDANGIDTLPNQAIFDAIQRMGYEGDLTVLTFNKALFSPQWSISEYCPHWRTAPKESSSKKQRSQRVLISKQGMKKQKEESISFTEILCLMVKCLKITIDQMETEDAQSEGRTKEMVDEDKEIDEDIVSTEDEVSTVKEKVSTDFEKVSTDKPKVSTDGSKVSTDEQIGGADDQVESTEEKNEGTKEIFESTEEKVESTAGQIEGTEDQTKEEIATQASQTSTQTPTSMIFGDDETIATLLLNMSKAKAVSKEKEKGVELKDVEEIDRPRPTSQRSLLTLKPLPKIDPKDKGKKKIEEDDESESEDDDIPQAVKKFKQLESDEELARKVQEEWEAEEERNRLAEEEATNEALIKNFDDIKARIEADRILAEKLQEQERDHVFTIEERAKFLHDTIAAQRKFLAQQRSEAIRNRPPTKNQLRNQMMTYLKHVGNFKHSELKSKKFEDIQAMYEKIKRSTEDFIAIGSVEDESLIKKMKKKDSSKGEEIKQESKEEVKQEDKEEETKKRKQGTRKKIKSRKRRFKQDTSQDDPSDIEKENDELRLCLTIAPV
ncbi:hypothetical protein Tco_0682328 [Tanacetum coccineum]|uniref:Uncharacterized protein n=1 Tax=Tanacetum coccineum TaxID=301880 RepID=A0ABQ4XS83_9ASTR